jgi:fructosamine-3-kinase
MLPQILKEHVLKKLSDYLGHEARFKSFSAATGGCINNGGRIEVDKGDFFLKWNDSKKYPGMFEAEASGLMAIGATQTIHVPTVCFTGESEDGLQYIVLSLVLNTTISLAPFNRSMYRKTAGSLFTLNNDWNLNSN